MRRSGLEARFILKKSILKKGMPSSRKDRRGKID
jgi:hypothetical protein